MLSPSGGRARCRDATQVGKAPLSPEMTISGLTESGMSGRIGVLISDLSPALPDVRPAPQAGCFVSRLKLSKDSAQITLRHHAFRTVAAAPSSASAKRLPAIARGMNTARTCTDEVGLQQEWIRSINPAV